MKPTQAILGEGCPVIEFHCQEIVIDDVGDQPSVGATSILKKCWETPCVASAHSLEALIVDNNVRACGRQGVCNTQACGSQGVCTTPYVPSAPALEVLIDNVRACGSQDVYNTTRCDLSDTTCGSGGEGTTSTSNLFHIDEEVFAIAPVNLINRALRTRSLVELHLPASPYRNYNPLGAGFDLETQSYASHLLWKGMDSREVPEVLPGIIDGMRRVVDNSSLCCQGAKVVLQWAMHLQERMLYYRSACLQG